MLHDEDVMFQQLFGASLKSSGQECAPGAGDGVVDQLLMPTKTEELSVPGAQQDIVEQRQQPSTNLAQHQPSDSGSSTVSLCGLAHTSEPNLVQKLGNISSAGLLVGSLSVLGEGHVIASLLPAGSLHMMPKPEPAMCTAGTAGTHQQRSNVALQGCEQQQGQGPHSLQSCSSTRDLAVTPSSSALTLSPQQQQQQQQQVVVLDEGDELVEEMMARVHAQVSL
jgi:hypothetical protein